MCKQEKIDKLVHELDTLFSKGVGHINIETKDGTTAFLVDKKFTECEEGKNACGIPTIFFETDE